MPHITPFRPLPFVSVTENAASTAASRVASNSSTETPAARTRTRRLAWLDANNAGRSDAVPDHCKAQVEQLISALNGNDPILQAWCYVDLARLLRQRERVKVNGVSLDRQRCSLAALKLDAESPYAFILLGTTLDSNKNLPGGWAKVILNGERYLFNQQQCFLAALERDARNSVAHYALALTLQGRQTIRINGVSMNRRDLYIRALAYGLAEPLATGACQELYVLDAEHERECAAAEAVPPLPLYTPRPPSYTELDTSTARHTETTAVQLPVIDPSLFRLDIDLNRWLSGVPPASAPADRGAAAPAATSLEPPPYSFSDASSPARSPLTHAIGFPGEISVFQQSEAGDREQVRRVYSLEECKHAALSRDQALQILTNIIDQYGDGKRSTERPGEFISKRVPFIRTTVKTDDALDKAMAGRSVCEYDDLIRLFRSHGFKHLQPETVLEAMQRVLNENASAPAGA